MVALGEVASERNAGEKDALHESISSVTSTKHNSNNMLN